MLPPSAAARSTEGTTLPLLTMGVRLPPADTRSICVAGVHRVNQVDPKPVMPSALVPAVSLTGVSRPGSVKVLTARSPSVRTRTAPSPGAKLASPLERLA